MNTPSSLIVGNIRDGEYEGLIAEGITPLLITDSRATRKIADAAKIPPTAHYDFSKGLTAELIDLTRRLLDEHSFTSVLNFREGYVAITAGLCAALPALAHLHRNVENTLDKALQRQCFQQSSNPDLQVMSLAVRIDDLLTRPDELPYPFILKPTNLYSSLFVRCIHDPQELLDYKRHEWPALQRYVNGKHRETDQLLLEEYLQGSNHSIDCAISPDGTISSFPMVDVISGVDIGQSDFQHFARYTPSILESDAALKGRCHRLAHDAVKALGLKGTFAHVEFILTAHGPRILEVGARPGGSRIHVIRQAWRMPLDVCYHRALSGEPLPQAESGTPQRSFGIVTPFARADRTYDGVHQVDRIRDLPGFQRWYACVRPGERIGPVSNGFQNYLYIEFRQPDTASLRASLLAVADVDVYAEKPGDAQVKHILLIGGRDSGLDWDTAQHFRFTLVQQPAQLSDYQRQHASLVLTADIANLAAYSETIMRLHRQRPFDAVVSFSEQGLIPASQLGERLGIAHNSLHSVEVSRDKLLFRQLLQGSRYELPCAAIDSADDARVFLARHGPAIVKPVNGSGSQGVYAISKPKDTDDLPLQGHNLIEAFASGDEYSVESLSLNGQHRILGITRKHTSGAPGYVETGHDFPANLDDASRSRIEDAVLWLLDRMDNRWGPAHTEIKIDGQRLNFIETQTRFGGDQIWEMVWRTTGVHLAATTIAAMTGVPSPVPESQYVQMAIRYIEADDATDPQQLHAHLLRHPFALRASLHHDKFGQPIHRSCDRHGYVLLACGADDNRKAFNAAISHPLFNTQGQAQ
ncbi:ATP-grasp domain-containing protein [Pseudomonas alkylphenolica]|uniref:ATP-grasp domain-containing protein n=1 Tax=Pseudomonas alkylphenolica TaxID=237609 RepID=A0A6I6GTL0_9PSED|nr:ATP-grasp domain-containing protein [Pseudomonas alkylphenolica]QGW77810.1 ATP-grasp domain-containing protein [Pseudomonas alkylphenolica]